MDFPRLHQELFRNGNQMVTAVFNSWITNEHLVDFE